MTRGFFVSGTDTGVGKTCVSVALIKALQAQGHVVVGMKPVASGCDESTSGLVNEDALALQGCASFSMPYRQVNPYAFAPAVAPHLAAQAEEVQIDIPLITETCRELSSEADRVVVASQLASDLGCIVVLKGADMVIAEGIDGTVYGIDATGNPSK